MPKSTKAEVMARVREVLELYLRGARLRDIRTYADAQGWKKSNTQLRRYMRKALDICEQEDEKDRAKLFALHRTQRRVLFAHAHEAADWGTALAILKDDAALLHLYDVHGVEKELAEAKERLAAALAAVGTDAGA